MPTNDFLSFAGAAGANVMSQAEWLADTADVGSGFSSGILPSVKLNKALRQSSAMTSALAQVVSNLLSQDVLDNGNAAALQSQIYQALATVGRNMTTITASTTFTVPAGVYSLRIRIWGGGGPGGNGNSGAGGGGAAGGYAEGYFPVTPGTTYAVTIGAGGTAGMSAGGASSFGSLVSATGGGGGGLGPNGPGSTAFGSGVGASRNSLGQSGQNGLSTSAQNTGGQGGSVVDYAGGAAQPVGTGGNAAGNNGQIACGGSGGVGTGSGGSGGTGLCVVEY
jgi:hypothetical protein